MTGIASLPMYDLPEVHWALDDLWAAIAHHLERHGVADVPPTLLHTRPLRELWINPDMFMSQCCGFNIVKNYTRWLQPLATPLYTAPGCDGSRYLSLVIVSETSTATGIDDLRGTICAVNGPESHSGMNTLRELVAPLSGGRPFFAEVRESGTHANSVAMVASGEAQVAAIDNVTHAMLARHRPAAVAGTRVLCETISAPGIPFAARTETDVDTVEHMRAAIIDAFAEPDLAEALDALFMGGVEVLPHTDYYELIDIERRAVGMCYPKLQ